MRKSRRAGPAPVYGHDRSALLEPASVALLAAGLKQSQLSTVLGFIAVLFATVNAVGGYMVTHRMLAMFRKKK